MRGQWLSVEQLSSGLYKTALTPSMFIHWKVIWDTPVLYLRTIERLSSGCGYQHMVQNGFIAYQLSGYAASPHAPSMWLTYNS